MKRFVLAAIGICCMENGFSDERIYLLDIVQSDKLEMTLGTPVWNGSGFELGANLEISGGEKDYAYLWSPSEYLNDAFIANPVTTDSDKRDYTLTVTDSRECSCSATVSTGADGMDPDRFFRHFRLSESGNGTHLRLVFSPFRVCPYTVGQHAWHDSMGRQQTR